MKITHFLKKNKITLPENSLQLCKLGLSMMRTGKDMLHDLNHIENILDYLDLLINIEPDLKKTINFEVLMLSICWHDTWKAGRQPLNPITILIDDLKEGLSSADLFKKYAGNYEIDAKIVDRVCYAIRKHSNFQILPTLGIEAKTLGDLDEMDFWNYSRISPSPLNDMLNNHSMVKSFLKSFYMLRFFRKLNHAVLEPYFKQKKLNLLKNL